MFRESTVHFQAEVLQSADKQRFSVIMSSVEMAMWRQRWLSVSQEFVCAAGALLWTGQRGGGESNTGPCHSSKGQRAGTEWERTLSLTFAPSPSFPTYAFMPSWWATALLMTEEKGTMWLIWPLRGWTARWNRPNGPQRDLGKIWACKESWKGVQFLLKIAPI